ncbi:hypothetical protein D3C86_1463780 [compost metagenome]
MERRVAQAEVEALVGLQQAVEDVFRGHLLAQPDGALEAVGLDDGARRSQCGGVDLRAEEAPAVLALAEQRIDAVGTAADVEHLDLRAARDLAAGVGGQQVGEGVDVVGAAGNRRAQVAGRDVPVLDAVELLE